MISKIFFDAKFTVVVVIGSGENEFELDRDVLSGVIVNETLLRPSSVAYVKVSDPDMNYYNKMNVGKDIFISIKDWSNGRLFLFNGFIIGTHWHIEEETGAYTEIICRTWQYYLEQNDDWYPAGPRTTRSRRISLKRYTVARFFRFLFEKYGVVIKYNEVDEHVLNIPIKKFGIRYKDNMFVALAKIAFWSGYYIIQHPFDSKTLVFCDLVTDFTQKKDISVSYGKNIVSETLRGVSYFNRYREMVLQGLVRRDSDTSNSSTYTERYRDMFVFGDFMPVNSDTELIGEEIKYISELFNDEWFMRRFASAYYPYIFRRPVVAEFSINGIAFSVYEINDYYINALIPLSLDIPVYTRVSVSRSESLYLYAVKVYPYEITHQIDNNGYVMTVKVCEFINWFGIGYLNEFKEKIKRR